MHRVGETTIFQMLEAPESIVKEITPPGVVCIPVGFEVSDTTHIILEGKAVPISGE
ncbi:hypothetical protein N5C67_09540 [Comamonas thiooxydans]|uniref:hypothetical protein n=1 Tax=Comamonas thiooxydans TaxID=363952 RepID=UPI002447066C|nr:hypothetical protein [Comamonas thiooxydans]MDH1252892.1 hypothetical protein [Comamonas thiooxydans]